MQIYVNNFPFTTTEEELRHLFEPYGTVETARIVTDRDTGRPRGFGFVEMPNATEAQAAIEGLNGTALGGRMLTVNEARPREERRPQPRGEHPRGPREERRPQEEYPRGSRW
jgi:RNA recognition motif-containing protein